MMRGNASVKAVAFSPDFARLAKSGGGL